MSESPCVSVVMPARNAGYEIGAAVASVRTQTFTDWELIVVDDGSEDGTGSAAGSAGDTRIRVVRQEPQGFVEALNRGLGEARGDVIMRLDADDEMLPRLMERQLAELCGAPHLGLVGTLAIYMPAGRVPARPGTDMAIRRFLLRDNPFVHSAVAFPRSVIDEVGPYDPAYGSDADYELWVRIAARFEVRIIQEPMVRYSVWDSSLSHDRRRSEAVAMRLRVQRRAATLLGSPVLARPYVVRSELAVGLWRVLEAFGVKT